MTAAPYNALMSEAPHASMSETPNRPPGLSRDPVPDWLIGTWRLVSVTRHDLATGAKADYIGPDPVGYINYSADRRMMVVIARSGRKKPAGAAATAAEADALMKSFVSYAGTYSIRGNEITHHVQASWNESWRGTDQTRLWRYDGARLHLDTPPSPDPVDGTVSVRSMVWERPA
jgi:hypothetical protein